TLAVVKAEKPFRSQHDNGRDVEDVQRTGCALVCIMAADAMGLRKPLMRRNFAAEKKALVLCPVDVAHGSAHDSAAHAAIQLSGALGVVSLKQCKPRDDDWKIRPAPHPSGRVRRVAIHPEAGHKKAGVRVGGHDWRRRNKTGFSGNSLS